MVVFRHHGQDKEVDGDLVSELEGLDREIEVSRLSGKIVGPRASQAGFGHDEIAMGKIAE